MHRARGIAPFGALLLIGLFIVGCGQAGSGSGIPGSQTVVVPNVVGGTLVEADNRLARSQLVCRSAPETGTEPQGTVLSEDPAPGEHVPNYSTVTVHFAVSPSFPLRELVGSGCAMAFDKVG